MIHYLVYASSATHEFSDDELKELLVKAREKNTRLGVTGMLLYKGGNFFQVLEGEAQTVKALYATIAKDLRHFDPIVVDEGDTERRQFAEWAMGFRNLTDPELAKLPGYSHFMNRALDAATFREDPAGSWGLLRLFRDTM